MNCKMMSCWQANLAAHAFISSAVFEMNLLLIHPCSQCTLVTDSLWLLSFCSFHLSTTLSTTPNDDHDVDLLIHAVSAGPLVLIILFFGCPHHQWHGCQSKTYQCKDPSMKLLASHHEKNNNKKKKYLVPCHALYCIWHQFIVSANGFLAMKLSDAVVCQLADWLVGA